MVSSPCTGPGLHGQVKPPQKCEKGLYLPKVGLVLGYDISHCNKIVAGAKCNRDQVVQDKKQVLSHKNKLVLVTRWIVVSQSQIWLLNKHWICGLSSWAILYKLERGVFGQLRRVADL